MDRIKGAYLRLVVRVVTASGRRAAGLLGVVVLLTAASGYYTATHLGFSADTADLLDTDLPFRQYEREFSERFPQLDNLIVVVVEGASRTRAEAAADKLGEQIDRNRDLIASVYRPGGGPFFARNGLLYLGLEDLWKLDGRLAQAQPFLGTMAKDPGVRGLFGMLGRALDEKLSVENTRLLAGMFDRISTVIEDTLAGRRGVLSWRDIWFEGVRLADGADRFFVLVQPRLDGADAGKVLEFVRRLAHQPALARDGVRARVTGSLAMEDEELASVVQSASLVAVLGFSLVCVILLIGVRSLRLIVAIVATLCVGLIWTAAFAAFAIGSLNLISASFAVLFVGMGVDFGIQFALRYAQSLNARGQDHRLAMQETAIDVGGALTLAAVAAALSFFAFAPTSYRGLAELGIIAGTGMAMALVANLTVLPALLTLLRIRASSPVRRWNPLARAGATVVRRRHGIVLAALLALIVSAVLAPRARFDFNPLNLRPATSESVATFRDLLENADTSPYSIEVVARDLAEARRLAVALNRLSLIDKAVALESYIPDAQEDKLAIIGDMNLSLGALLSAAPATGMPTLDQEVTAFDGLRRRLRRRQGMHYGAPFTASVQRLREALDTLRASALWPGGAIAQLEPRLAGDFEDVLRRLRVLLTAEAVTLENLPADLKSRYIASDGRARIEVFPKEDLSDNLALRRFVAQVRGVAPGAIGLPVALLAGSDAVIGASVQATVLALAATSLLIVLVRGLASALLVVLPLLLAIVFTLAGSVLLDRPFDFANITALPLLVGLSNAFGIYLVSRKRTQGDVQDLFRGSTPAAVLFSGFTTMASFGALAVATHPGMSHMGILVGLALSMTLLSALIVLPAVMSELDAWRLRRSAHSPTPSSPTLHPAEEHRG